MTGARRSTGAQAESAGPTSNGRTAGPEKIVTLALPGVVPFSLSVPNQVFTGPVPLEQQLYQLTVCSSEARVRTSDGYDIDVGHRLDALEDADLVIVPGSMGPPDEFPADALKALTAAHERGTRIASLCSGAFYLGAAGLLDGRRVTTHWLWADDLRRRCPRALVEPNTLFCDDGPILSSAGLAAGIDLCLHIVAAAHGAELANRCARYLVAAPHRPGGQAQYIEHPVPERDDSSLAATRVWMLEHLGDGLSLDVIAGHAHMSRRTFTRQFRAETGRSPLDWLLEQRLIRARLLLETTTDPIPMIAQQAGLGTDAALRHHFRHVLGVTPSAYRRSFTTT